MLEAAGKLFDHMDNVCGYIDGFVQLAKVEATFGNTRLALLELACREQQGSLKRGYLCDGLDHTCDEGKMIDECAEDIFPPEVDASLAVAKCSMDRPVYKHTTAALACANGLVQATDDCQPVAVFTASQLELAVPT